MTRIVDNANYWIKKIGLEGVPVSKLNNIQEVLEHPQIISRNMIVDVKFSKNKKIKVAGNPIKFSNFRDNKIRKASPSLDGDRLKILKDFNIKEQ